MKKINTIICAAMIGSLTIGLTGCGAISTAIQHEDLKVQTKMSNTIFLNPIAKDQRLVYIQIHNTSDKPDVKIAAQLKADLEQNGWPVTDDFAKAKQLLQVNILQVGEMDKSAVDTALDSGYGGALLGGAIAGFATDSVTGGLAVAGAVKVGEVVADSMVKDVNYAMITDVQLSLRLPKGAHVKQTVQSNMKEGSQTTIKQSYSTDSQWQRYQTRVVSSADKVNLKFVDAQPVLEARLSQSIANIL